MDYKDKIREILNDTTIPPEQREKLEDVLIDAEKCEDEKIRKELITHCRNTRRVTEEGAERIAKWISWLEKQSKQETICDKCRKEHPSHSCQDITELGRCQVKESTKIQHDNKTCKENNDSLTDDERIKEEIIDFIYDKTDTYELREKSNSWLTWLEKQGIKPLGQVEDKTELAETEDNKVITDWSEEDKKMFRSLHNLIYVVRDCDCNSMEKEELSDWLESIKDRVQPKQEWSEEDEYLLGETIQHLEELIRIDKAKHCACDVQYYQRDIDWLKSLKERALHLKLLKECINCN